MSNTWKTWQYHYSMKCREYSVRSKYLDIWRYLCLHRNTYFYLFFWQPLLFVLRMGIDSILEHYLNQPHLPLILDVVVAFLFAPFLVLHHNTSLPKKTYLNIYSMQISKFVSNSSLLPIGHYFILLLSRQNVSVLMQKGSIAICLQPC